MALQSVPEESYEFGKTRVGKPPTRQNSGPSSSRNFGMHTFMLNLKSRMFPHSNLNDGKKESHMNRTNEEMYQPAESPDI